MTFQEMQDGVMRVAETYRQRYGVVVDQDFAFLKLYEEVGEFAKAVLIHRKKSKPEKHTTEEESKEMLASELADIIGLAIINANLLGIDLERAIEEKWLSKA
jgi:NTP pyrophosphatase (non-canonical NTP hydrolase)